MDGRARSTEEIRQDIARQEENLSKTAHQIGDRIKEKLDWSEYVKNSPYCALGIAVGMGFFASRVLPKRTTPMERIIGSLAEELRDSLGGYVGAAPPSLVKATLLGIGTKLAVEWLRHATSTSGSEDYARSPSEAERDMTFNPVATT